MYEDVGVGMTVQAFVMRNLDATENQLSAFNQGVDVITDTNVDHVRNYRDGSSMDQEICSEPLPQRARAWKLVAATRQSAAILPGR